MPPRSLLSSIIFAGVTAFFLFSAPQTVSAQTLIDFLWGGSKEWGGEKQTVAFDPKYTPGQIIVSFGDRRLYHITARGRATSYPIAVPREKSRWQGTTKVSAKRENPSWRPTPEMLRENPKLPTWVPGGHPMNPLGVRALYLGASAYRIHGTDAPWTIGQAVSQGCIRMFNKDVLDLYPKIPVGTRVTVTWDRFKTQDVAASDYDSSDTSSYDPSESPFQSPAFHKTGFRRHTGNHKLPPVPSSGVEEAQTAAVRMEGREPAPLTEETVMRMPEVIEAPIRRPKITPETAKTESEKTEPKAKAEAVAVKKDEPAKANAQPAKTEQVAEPKKPAKPTEADEKPTKTAAAHAAPTAASAAEAARKAAAAAAKAAQAAREAAELARKAAASAKKATTSSTAPAKSDAAEPAKSAAL